MTTEAAIELDNDGRSLKPASTKVLWASRQVRRIQPTLVLAILVILVVAAWAVAPSLFTSANPLVGTPADQLKPPSPVHWFGTDDLGRDVLSRVIYGAVQSLTGAIVAVSVGLVAGTILGVLAGSLGRTLDDILMRIVDVMLAIPSLLLSLSIITLLGFGTVNASIAVGITSIALFARLTRSQVVKVRRTDYVEAAIGGGARLHRVLWRHVLPNSIGPVVAMAALQFGSAILQISTLGFLGFGPPPPTPEWGLMIAEGRDYIATSWWLTALPGLVVVAVVLASHRISRWLSGRGRS
jgi:peptide/nickel transport system permease protein